MKKIISVLVIILMLTLVACSKGKNKSADDLNKDLNDVVSEYKNASSVQAKITLTSGDATQTIDVSYTVEDSKVKALATVLTDSDGTASVYVKDGVCYIARYSSPKQKYTATDTELSTLASNYSIEKYIEEALNIFNKEFFKASSVDAVSKESYKLTCDLDALQVSDDISDDEILEAEARVEKLKAMESVELVVNYSNKKIASIEGSFTKDSKTSTIKIEFISTSAKEVSIPNESEYQNK